MKRALTFVAALALMALYAMPAQAQESPARFGLQGGVSVSNFSGDAVEGTDSKTGFLAGATFDYFFSGNFGLGLEANWLSGLGAKEGDVGEVKLSYISFPLTLTFALPLGDEEKTVLGLEGGIAANLKLNCDATSFELPGGTSDDCGDLAESVAWSVPLGAGIGFATSDKSVVFLKARYQLGLSDTFKDLSDAKLNWWEFLLGVSFIP